MVAAGSFQIASLFCVGQLIATRDDLIPDDGSYRQCPRTALCEFQELLSLLRDTVGARRFSLYVEAECHVFSRYGRLVVAGQVHFIFVAFL